MAIPVDIPVVRVGRFLRYALALMVIPMLIGVAGVITLPADIVSGFIFVVVRSMR